jgi:hypothetical protein
MATARLSFIALTAPALFAGSMLSACTDVESPTELEPEGPPMVRQVFVYESVLNCPDTNPDCGIYRTSNALAYGTHPTAVEMGIKHQVTTAAPLTGQTIRIVMDELLIGNYLEEIACNGLVDNDQYQAVPLGTTPDDVAACAVPPDVLDSSCKGEHAVCIGPEGPIGVLDENEDGASDDTQFIDGAVGLRCGDGGAINVPIDLQATYWQPSGNQQVPAAGGLGALGPAIVLEAIHGLPTGSTCQLVFGEMVTDKSGIRPCGPQWGAGGAPDELDIWPPEVPCDEGDTSAVTFSVEALRITGGRPADGATNFPRLQAGETFAQLSVNFNAEMATSSFEDLTLTPTPAGEITIELQSGNTKTVLIKVEGGLAAQTEYTLSVPAPADYYGAELGTDYTVTFTTGN